jgi:hypothetical protein
MAAGLDICRQIPTLQQTQTTGDEPGRVEEANTNSGGFAASEWH